jgi:antitoxin component YwqK of YwqJK toxin-antitoxin module
MISNMVSRFFSRQHSSASNVFRNGAWKEHNRQGIVIREGYYKNGLQHGVWKIFSDANGELVIEEEYTDGVLHGKYRSYHDNGIIFSEGSYRLNKRDGDFKIYNRSGDLIKVMKFRNDVLTEVREICGPRSQLQDKKLMKVINQ